MCLRLKSEMIAGRFRSGFKKPRNREPGEVLRTSNTLSLFTKAMIQPNERVFFAVQIISPLRPKSTFEGKVDIAPVILVITTNRELG